MPDLFGNQIIGFPTRRLICHSFYRGVVEHVIQSFADKIQATSGNEEETSMQIDIDYYRLNEDKVCRFFAEQILKHARKVLDTSQY